MEISPLLVLDLSRQPAAALHGGTRMSLLQAIDLGRRFGGTIALERLNLSVEAGEVLCFDANEEPA